MKITKLLLSLAIAGTTVAQFTSNAYAETTPKSETIIEEEGEMNFSDVSPNHWAYKSIKRLIEEYKVLGGFPDGTFRGNRNLTRHEAAAMLIKVMDRVEDLVAKGGSGSTRVVSGGASKADLDKLKKEFATELEDLQNEVKKVAKDVQDLQKDLDETKDDLDSVKDMLPKVKVTGDVVTRYEALTKGGLTDFNSYDAKNSQVRARIGVTGEMDGWQFATRLVTSDATDITNQFASLGQLNSKLGVSLDQAYVAARPWDSALDLTLGRHANPFVKVTELVWDEDVTFDGAYLKLRFGDEDATNLKLYGDYSLFRVAGVDMVKNLRGKHSFAEDANGTSGMFSGGGSVTFGGMDSGMMLMLGGNYHSVNNINNLIGKQVGYNVRTNVLTSNGDVKSYVSKFNLGTGSAKLVLFPDSYLPVSLYGDVSYNLGAGQNISATGTVDSSLKSKAMAENLGFVGGLMLGSLKDAGSIMLDFKYKKVGTDSVMDLFNEDQLLGTNREGYEGRVGIKFASNTVGMLTYQMAKDLVAQDQSNNLPTHTVRASLKQSF